MRLRKKPYQFPFRQALRENMIPVALTALGATILLFALAGRAHSQLIGPGPEGQTGAHFIAGVVEATVDNPGDRWSKGWIVLEGGRRIRVPANMIIDLPANRVTIQQFCEEMPPQASVCMEGHVVEILANRVPSLDGSPPMVIAGDIWIHKDDQEHQGIVTEINRLEGYFVVDEEFRVRFNDPESVHSLQTGSDCHLTPAGEVRDNCSPDPRYTNDPTNYTFTSTTGFPFCINGPECAIENRPGKPGQSGEIPNALRFAPLLVGDHVSTTGAIEEINGIPFQSAHSINVGVGISTPPNTADYIVVGEAEWDAPTYANQRLKSVNIGFTTGNDNTSIYKAFYNGAKDLPINEILHWIAGTEACEALRFEGTCRGNALLNAPGLGQVMKINYDWDFIVGESKVFKNPAAIVRHRGDPSRILGYDHTSGVANGADAEDSFRIFAPVNRDVIYTTDAWNRCVEAGGPDATLNSPTGPCFDVRDANNKPAQWGFYLSPNGIGHPEWDEIDMAAFMTPFVFEGEPWNLDRRLGPDGGDERINPDPENLEKHYALGELGLDPFPYSGMNPCGFLVDGTKVANADALGQAVPRNCAERVGLDPITGTVLETDFGRGFHSPMNNQGIADPLARGNAGIGGEAIGPAGRRAGRRVGRRLGALLDGIFVVCRRDGRQGAIPNPACEARFGIIDGAVGELFTAAETRGGLGVSLVNKSLNKLANTGDVIFQRERFDLLIANVPVEAILGVSEVPPVTAFVTEVNLLDEVFVEGAQIVFTDAQGGVIKTFSTMTAAAQIYLNELGERTVRQDVVQVGLSLRLAEAALLVPFPGSIATVFVNGGLLAQFQLTGDSTVDFATGVLIRDITDTPNQLALAIASVEAQAVANQVATTNPADFDPGAAVEPVTELPTTPTEPDTEASPMGGTVGIDRRFSQIFECGPGFEAVADHLDVECREGIQPNEWRCRGRRLESGTFIGVTCEPAQLDLDFQVGVVVDGLNQFVADQRGKLLGAVGNCPANQLATADDPKVVCTTFRNGSFRCKGEALTRSQRIAISCSD